MADVFLPKTQAVYGRDSRRWSHWLHCCLDIKDRVTHRDVIANKIIAEIRVSHQSMAPPSSHPEGETVEWECDDPKEMVVEKALLVRHVQLMTMGAMVARYYNPPGDRHEWGSALPRLRRRLTLTQYEAEREIDKAGPWVNDDKVKDRLDAVRNTYARDEDAPATGAKRLEDRIGEHGKAVVATLYKIWSDDAGTCLPGSGRPAQSQSWHRRWSG